VDSTRDRREERKEGERTINVKKIRTINAD
jgi:hypothetical protein